MKKIKQFEKNVGRIQTNIKNEADQMKKNKGQHNIPIGQGGFPMMPASMMNPQNKMPMMPNQPVYPMMHNQMPPQMGMGGIPPMGMVPHQMGGMVPPMGMISPQMVYGMQSKPLAIEMRNKIDMNYEKREYLIKTCKDDPAHFENVKKQLLPQLRFVLETDLKKPQ